MHSLLLQFALADPVVTESLLHELNLHDSVEARRKDDRPADDVVILVALPDIPRIVWEVRSAVSLFDPAAVELGPDHQR